MALMRIERYYYVDYVNDLGMGRRKRFKLKAKALAFAERVSAGSNDITTVWLHRKKDGLFNFNDTLQWVHLGKEK